METLIKDLKYGIRSFLKRPGFLVIAVSTLALGIGATTARAAKIDPLEALR